MVAKVIADGVLHHYVSGARLSWVDVDNVAEVALTLAFQNCMPAKRTDLAMMLKF
jgi:hypothetical protein